MGETCRLREANGVSSHLCDSDACVFWRAVTHVGAERAEGCAIQHFELLGDSTIAAWLLSVKDRVENTLMPTT